MLCVIIFGVVLIVSGLSSHPWVIVGVSSLFGGSQLPLSFSRLRDKVLFVFAWSGEFIKRDALL